MGHDMEPTRLVKQVLQPLYSNIAPVVGIVSRHSFRVEVHCINQPNKSKVVFHVICHGELCHDVLYVTTIAAYPVYVRVSVCV